MRKTKLLLFSTMLLAFALTVTGCLGFLGSKTTRVSGTVKFAGGSAVAGAKVALGDLNTATNESGTFVFAEVKQGDYVLKVFIEGNEVYSQKVTAADKPVSLNVVVPDPVKLGSVEGTVTTKSGAAVANAVIAIDYLELQSQTGVAGHYVLVDVPYGSHNLVMRIDGETVYSADLEVDADTVVHDIEVADAVQRFVLAGSVSREDGTPVSGAGVRVAGVSGGTDASGQFELDGVLAGSHTLYISIDGKDVHTEIINVDSDMDVDVVVPISTVSGRLVKDNGEPLAGAQISLAGLLVEADGAGEFVLDNVLYGEYPLHIVYDGETVLSETLDVNEAEMFVERVVRIPPLPVHIDPALPAHAALFEQVFGTPWDVLTDPAGDTAFYMGTQVADIPSDTHGDIRYVLMTYEDLATPELYFESRGGTEGSGNPSHYVIFGWQDYQNYYYAYIAASTAAGISRVVDGNNEVLYRTGTPIWERDRDNYHSAKTALTVADGKSTVDVFVDDELAFSYTFASGKEPPAGRVGIGMWNLTHSAWVKNIVLDER